MLLSALIENKILKAGDSIVANRVFDTTIGHIRRLQLNDLSLNPLPIPETFYNSDTVFMGNINKDIFDIKSHNLLLMTLTDNSGGG